MWKRFCVFLITILSWFLAGTDWASDFNVIINFNIPHNFPQQQTVYACGLTSPMLLSSGLSLTATRYAAVESSLTCWIFDHAGTAKVSRADHRKTTRGPVGGSTMVRPRPS